jgi:hypothetical protein
MYFVACFTILVVPYGDISNVGPKESAASLKQTKSTISRHFSQNQISKNTFPRTTSRTERDEGLPRWSPKNVGRAVFSGALSALLDPNLCLLVAKMSGISVLKQKVRLCQHNFFRFVSFICIRPEISRLGPYQRVLNEVSQLLF